jgi:hypothetical protein
MSVPPIGRTNEPAGIADAKRAQLQSVLDKEYKDIPAGTPVGCNLVVIPAGRAPLYLNAGHLQLNAPQHWGSVSKQFTAACIAKLIGKIQWSDDIRTYLKELPEFTFNGAVRKVAIDDLLHMRSGLPEMTTLAALAGKNDQTLTMKERFELLKRFPVLQFEPDSEQMYCNTNYYLLAEIVERVSGRPFVDFVREEIFAPNMRCRCSVDPSCERSVDGYSHDYRRNTTPCTSWGATGVVGPPSDMVQWNKAFDRGELDDLLVPSSKAHAEPGHPVYCRGLNVEQVGDYRVIYHAGAIDGFTTQFMRYEHRDPAKSFTFFLTTNIDDIPRVQKMAHGVVNVLAGLEAQMKIEEPSEPPRAIPIPKSAAAPYEGVYESPLGVRYRMKAEEEGGSWILHLLGEKEQKIAAFVPTQGEKGIVFRGPMGDWIEMTETGFVLKGARVAPFPFVRS